MKKVIKIEGMMCQNCVRHVKESLEAVKGVTAAEVSLEKNIAEVSFADGTEVDALRSSVEKDGYKVIGIE